MSTREMLTLNGHVRMLGEDAPASKTLLRAAKQENPNFQLVGNPPNVAQADFCMIDSALQLDHAKALKDFPQPGLGYAGFTPHQRAAYLVWLDDPLRPAPMAFQQLYVATLEVALFEGKKEAIRAQRELMRLDTSPQWANSELLDRALLLSFWLAQDGPSLVRWLTHLNVCDSVTALAIGQVALLNQPVTTDLLLSLMKIWKLLETDLKLSVIELRVNALYQAFEKDLLLYALEQSTQSARTPQPWRCAHRDLRIAIPQPNLRPILEPLLRETTMVVDAQIDPSSNATDAVDGEEDGDQEQAKPPSRNDWNLVLEFEHSRSAYFDFALALAQRQEGYTMLLDENRRMIYRVVFRKNKLSSFWRLWNWVQTWGGTHVYVNGKELEKWQVWPYSQYLR